MKKSFLPLFTTPSIILDRKTTFHKINEKVVVEAPGKLIRQLIETCDGTHALDEVIQLLKDGWDEHSIRGLIEELHRHDVLIDSRYLSDTVWKAVENPSYFSSLLTKNDVAVLVERAKKRQRSGPSDKVYQVSSSSSFGRLLERRQSVRSFSGESVGLQSIVQILWSAYGEISFLSEDIDPTTNCRKTVPSAGALYPLMISIALFKDTRELHSGIYNVWMGSPKMVGFNLVSRDTDRLTRSFLDPLMFEGAHGVIVVSGSFKIASEKYGNRSLLFVPLEAGHVAQNVHISASESGIATVEVGGFVEELLAEAIELPKYYNPLTTVVFGREKQVISTNIPESKIEVSWAIPMAGRYRLPFAMASARVSSVNRDWSCGRAVSPQLAHVKAVSEAKEWAACGCISPTLIKSKIADLETAIDSREIIKFHSAQYRLKGFSLKPFNDNVEYAWVQGKDELRGSEVHILTDCVYFPYYPETPRYAFANSSGVAAHPERQQAIKNGVLELIERDSFMIAYLTKIILPIISEKTLPAQIQKRISNLSKIGFKVWVKDHSLDLAPVVCIIAQNKEMQYTTCASCSGFDITHAVDHALMEVEGAVLMRLQNGKAKSIKPIEVRMPLDHGNLYDQKQYFRKADFLAHGKSIAFRDIGSEVARSWQELLDRLVLKRWQLLTTPLYLSDEYGGNGDLHIVRSVVPGMVPMTFGYQQEPAGMERIYDVARELGNRKLLYPELTKFPHPFA